MPKAFPREIREDVIRVYRDADSSVAQVAKDFGVSPSCLKRWLTMDERNSARSSRPAQAVASPASCVRRVRGIKLLEQENEVLRRPAACLTQADLPGR